MLVESEGLGRVSMLPLLIVESEPVVKRLAGLAAVLSEAVGGRAATEGRQRTRSSRNCRVEKPAVADQAGATPRYTSFNRLRPLPKCCPESSGAPTCDPETACAKCRRPGFRPTASRNGLSGPAKRCDRAIRPVDRSWGIAAVSGRTCDQSARERRLETGVCLAPGTYCGSCRERFAANSVARRIHSRASSFP